MTSWKPKWICHQGWKRNPLTVSVCSVSHLTRERRTTRLRSRSALNFLTSSIILLHGWLPKRIWCFIVRCTAPRRHIAFKLMHELGFELDEHTFDDLFADVDYRGDGTVTRDEFITALGMVCRAAFELFAFFCLVSRSTDASDFPRSSRRISWR